MVFVRGSKISSQSLLLFTLVYSLLSVKNLLAFSSRSSEARPARCSSSSSFLSPEEIDNFSAILEEAGPAKTGARPKSKTKKVNKTTAGAKEKLPVVSTSVGEVIRLELPRKENLAIQLKITETELQLTQLKTTSSQVAVHRAAHPDEVKSAMAPNGSSPSSVLQDFELPSLDQLRASKNSGSLLPNNFLFFF